MLSSVLLSPALHRPGELPADEEQGGGRHQGAAEQDGPGLLQHLHRQQVCSRGRPLPRTEQDHSRPQHGTHGHLLIYSKSDENIPNRQFIHF